MTGRLGEKTLQIWRAVAAAGCKGLSAAELLDRFKGVIASEPLYNSLTSLKAGKYLHYKGELRFGRWMLNEACVIPKGELAPTWLLYPDEDEVELDESGRRKVAETKLPTAPCSVFHQGETPMTAKVGKGRPIETPPARPPAAAAAVDAWKAPAVIVGLSEAEKRALLQPVETVDAAPQTGVDAIQSGASLGQRLPMKRDFVCSLDSDGDLLIYANGDELCLDAKHVRKLVDYLDRVNAAEWLRA